MSFDIRRTKLDEIINHADLLDMPDTGANNTDHDARYVLNAGGAVTDNAIVLWDGTGGKTIKNSNCTIDASGNLITAGDITTSGNLCTESGLVYIGSTCVSCYNDCLLFSDFSGSYYLSDLSGGGSSLWVDGGTYVYLSSDKDICTSYDVCGYNGCFSGCLDGSGGVYCGGYGGGTDYFYTGDSRYAYFCGGSFYYVS